MKNERVMIGFQKDFGNAYGVNHFKELLENQSDDGSN